MSDKDDFNGPMVGPVPNPDTFYAFIIQCSNGYFMSSNKDTPFSDITEYDLQHPENLRTLLRFEHRKEAIRFLEERYNLDFCALPPNKSLSFSVEEHQFEYALYHSELSFQRMTPGKTASRTLTAGQVL